MSKHKKKKIAAQVARKPNTASLTPTEREIRCQQKIREQIEYENCMQILADCGVPFAPDETPLGIGWD